MAVREHQDPDCCRDHAGHAHGPCGREALFQDRRGPIERALAEREHGQHDGEDDRFLEVETFEQRCDDARDQ